ncbi:MAG TPA: AMP-binding protein [Blastocatellia bacterium]|nr:AMP-binding protein [Blastocatellia bacterium]
MRNNLLSFLDDAAARGGATAFAHYRGLRVVRWSNARVRATAFQFARELESRGITQGDRVLFWADNSAEWVAAFFGCLLARVIVVPLDVESAPEFVSRVQERVGAKLLLSSGGRQAGVPVLPLEDLSEIIKHHSTEACSVKEAADGDIAEIIFTSGTTAEPKGVCLTHRNLLANLAPIEREIQKYIKWERPFHPIRFLDLLPLSHVFGQFMGIFVPMILGGEVFFQGSLNPSEIIATIKRQRVSVVVTVPRFLDSMRNKIERDYAARGESKEFHNRLEAAGRLHFLKRWWVFRRIHSRFGWKFWAFVSGGAALGEETETFWRQLGFVVVQGYGMTETAALISVNHPFKVGRGSIGKALPGQEMKLDESGEILVRGQNVSPGYWSGGLKPLTNEEGWLRTGDIGEMDEAGNLYFKSRKKDVIVTAAGMNIYPEDLEAALKSQPEIRDSAVIGVDTAQGPEPMAVLVLNEEQADASAAVKRANKALAGHQQIRRWAIWPEQDFPRTPTQKVRKPALLEKIGCRVPGAGGRDWLSNISDLNSSDLPAPDTRHPASSFIVETVARVSGEAPVDASASANLATDLKLDSLGRVELLSALEDHYQVDIDEAAFTAATTVGDIERMLREGSRGDAVEYPYPKWARHFPVTWIRFIVFYLVMRPLTWYMSRAKVVGKERLKGVRGPVLFVANHVTRADQSLIQLALPARFHRRLAIAMEGEKLRGWRHPPEGTGWFERLRLWAQYVLTVSLLNVFPLPQKSGFRRSFAYAGEMMDRGYSVLVFPEGRRTPDGKMHDFMEGIGLLATELNAAVVPVRLDGLHELRQEKRRFARPGEVSVTIGEPVKYSRDDDSASIARDLHHRVASL